MKKLIAILFCAFVVAGCATTEKSPYEIDPVATANAPWEVGNAIRSDQKITTIFLGVTPEGYIVVQDFDTVNGSDDIKRTEPYIVMNANTFISDSAPSLYHGRFISYNSDGSLGSSCLYAYGTTQSPPCIIRSEDGESESEYTVNYDSLTGLYETHYVHFALSDDGKERRIVLMLQSRGIFGENGYSETSTITHYHDNGVKSRESSWRDLHNRVGVWRKWDQEGNLIEETDYGSGE